VGKNIKSPGSQRRELLIAPKIVLFQGSNYSTIIVWVFVSPFLSPFLPSLVKKTLYLMECWFRYNNSYLYCTPAPHGILTVFKHVED